MQKRNKILISLLFLLLCFIWGNSLMPAQVSASLSGMVKSFLNSIFGAIGSGGGLCGDGLLRKVAHASEFAALGVIITMLANGSYKTYFFSLAFLGLSVAFLDETIQLFVAGRSGQISDIWIDFGGYTIGVFIVWCIFHSRFAKQAKRE